MTLALLLTSLGFGLRHGLDWDHIAAIADLSSNAENRRRGFLLSMMYAVGHGAVVFALGVLVLLVGATLPDSVDQWMGRVVGLTLVVLGLAILIGLVRKGRDFRLQSRWMLIINGTFAGVRKVRNATTRRSIAVEHEHRHAHDSLADDIEIDDEQAHDHAHGEVTAPTLTEPTLAGPEQAGPEQAEPEQAEPALAEPALAAAITNGAETTRRRWPSFHRHGHTIPGSTSHSHPHRHELALPDQPTARYSGGTATGIGMIHGVGIESPTQIAVFVGASAAAGMASGLMLLSAWVLGLIIANAGLALVTGFGLLSVERNYRLYVAVAVVMAVLSIALGLLYLSGAELG